MKDFTSENNPSTSNSKESSVREILNTGPSSLAYVVQHREADGLPLNTAGVEYGGEFLEAARVYGRDEEMQAFLEADSFSVTEVEIPSGSDRDAFLKKWIKRASKNKKGLSPLLLLPLAACGGSGTEVVEEPPLTFVVTEAAGKVSFSGTQTGDIVASTSGVTTTFTRGTLTGSVDSVFDAGAAKELVVASGQSVTVSGSQIDGGALKVTGAGNVTINATDAGVGAVTAVSTNANVVLSGGTLTFDMSNDNEDSITLTSGSVLNLGGGTLVVSDGKVFASGIDISNIGSVVLNSALEVDIADFKEIQDAGGFTGSGTLEVKPSANDAVDNSTNLSGLGISAGSFEHVEFTEAEFKSLFTSANANAAGNVATLAASSVTISGSVSDTTVLASLQANIAKVSDNGVSGLTLADDDAVDTYSALIADGAVAANSITLTDGAIAVAGAKTVVLSQVAKFKADQIDSIALSDAEAAVTGFLADDAFNANSVTIGAVTTSEAAVLANGREIADNGITAINITAAEFDAFIDANTNAPFAAESVTLGAVTTNQADVVANIAKVSDGGITAITLTSDQYDAIEANADAIDAFASDAITSMTMDEASYKKFFISSANASDNLAKFADSSITISGSVSDVAVLNSLQANVALVADGGLSAITLADDDAVDAYSTLIADAAVAANSITLTDGAIAVAGAKTVVLSQVAKFKADQIDSIALSDAEAAVTGFLADDAFNANSVTIGAVTTSEAAVLANGREIADNGITAINITAAEFDAFIDANTNAPFAAESVTLGAVTTNQADVLANISKVVDGGITAITLTSAQFDDLVQNGGPETLTPANAYDALASGSVSISNTVPLTESASVAQQAVKIVANGVSTSNGITITGENFELLTDNNANALQNGSANISGAVDTTTAGKMAANTQSGAIVDHVAKLVEGTVVAIDMTADQYEALADIVGITSTMYASSVNSPDGSKVTNASDGINTSNYSNTDKVGSGIIADLGSDKIVRSIDITTSSDSPESDPLTVSVYGWNSSDDVAAGASSNVAAESVWTSSNWVIVAENIATNLPNLRSTKQTVSLDDNNTAYDAYKIVFTSVRDADSSSSAKVAEVALQGTDPLSLKSVTFADAIDGNTVADIVADPNRISDAGIDDAAVTISQFEQLFANDADLLDTGSEGAVVSALGATNGDLRGLLTTAKLAKIQTLTNLDFEADSFSASETNTLLSKASGAQIDMLNADATEVTMLITHVANIAAAGISNVSLTPAQFATLDAAGKLGTNAGTVSGSIASGDLAYVIANLSEISAIGDITITGGAISPTNADTLMDYTSGIVTATVDMSGGVTAVNTALANSGVDALTMVVNVADATMTQAELQDLIALDGKTSVAIDASAVTSVTGTHAELMSLYAASEAGTITGLGNEAITANDAGITVSQVNDLASKTIGAVTATLSNTALADFATLEGTGNAYTISIGDAALDADALEALNAKTSVDIKLTGDTSISGTLANVNAVIVTKTGYDNTTINTAIDVNITDTISATNAELILNDTTGVVTATITPATAAAINTALAANATANDLLSITVTDSSVDPAILNALDGKTGTDINVSAVNTISGTQANIDTLYGNTANFVGLGNENITVTGGTITVGQANTIAGYTSGTITAQIAAGTANALTGLNGTGNAYTLDVSDGANVDAADLLALNGKTTVPVDLQLITAGGTALNGNYTELKALFAAAAEGDYSGLAANLPITIDDNVSVSQANEIHALTSAAVTATISDTVLADYAGLEGTGNAYTISIGDAALDADALEALNAKTSVDIKLTGDTSISGTLANVNAVIVTKTGYDNATINTAIDVNITDTISATNAELILNDTTGVVTATITPATAAAINTALAANATANDLLSITVTDSSVDPAILNALDGKTGTDINVSAVNTISGTQANIDTLYGNTANFVGLGNENITVTGGTITVGQANTIAGYTSGTITAQIAAGTANALTGLNGTGNAYTLDVSDGANVDAADLLALNGKTTVPVDLQLITAGGTALNGNYTELKALFAAAAEGDYSGLAANLPITIDDNVSVSQANEIHALTSAAVTATISDTVLADYAGLEGTGNAYTISIGDAALDADALEALNAKTSVDIKLTGDTSISGTLANVNAVIVTKTGYDNATINTAIDVNITDTISATNAELILNDTTGVVTATITPATAAAINTALAANATANDLLSITVTDSSVDPAILNALDGKTGTDINVSAVNTISGAQANIDTLYGNTANFVGLGNENITVTGGTITVGQANTIAGYTSGTITAQIAAGTANALTGLNGTGNAYTLDVSDGANVDAADLLALNGKTTVPVDLQLITAGGTALNGNYTELKALFAAAAEGDYSGLAANLPITIDDNVSVSQANEIHALTSAAVTATISDTVLADYAGLEGTGNAYTISIGDAALDADALEALNAKTSVDIKLTGDTSISGTLANVNAVIVTKTGYDNTTINTAIDVNITDTISATNAELILNDTTGVVTATITPATAAAINTALAANATANDLLSITVTDSSVDPAILNALDGKTGTDINVSAVNTISGTQANIDTLYGNTANFVGLGNENITVTGGTITVGQANTIAGYTSGTITAQIAAGTANALTGLNGTGNAYTLDVSDGANVDAADLLALNGKTTVPVDLQLITAGGTALNGNYTELKALFAAAAEGDYSGLAANLPITIDDNVSVSQANEIHALTSAAVTATISDTVLADYAGLEGTGNAYTISIGDAALDADALEALNAKTSVDIKLTGDTSISGTLANVNAVIVTKTGYDNATINTAIDVNITDTISATNAELILNDTTGVVTATITPATAAAINTALAANATANDLLSITVTDSSVDPAILNALDGKTGTDINVSAVNTISGARADIDTLYGNTANFVGLGNENITVTGGTITVAQANTLHGFTSGVVTSTISATGATGAQLTSLAGFGDKVGSTITNLTLTITDATSDQSRSQQFAEVTDSLAQVLFDNVGTNSVTITGNADADWINLGGFDTTNVSFTINGLAGNNVIYSGDGNDTITTTTGDDYVEVGGGLDAVDTGDGNDTIAVRSLNNVDGSSYTGGVGDDTIKVYGTNDLTNSTLSGIENIELLPGSPSIVTLTIDQVKDLSKVTGTSGNSELIVVQNAAQVTVAGGGTLVGDNNGNDTLAFNYNGTAYTATIPANTAINDGGTALNALIDAATTGGGAALGADKVTATYNGANLILQVDDPLTAGVATTLTGVTYTDATAGAAASNTTTTTDVDLSSITFSGLQKLTTSSGVTATVTVAQMADISEVASDNNSLGLNLNGVPLAADLDISAASLQSSTIHITNMAGYTLTTNSAQIEAARVDQSTGSAGIVKVLMTADSDLDDAFLTTLARGGDGASIISTNHDLRLVLDSSTSPKADFDLTTETANTFTTAVNSVEVKADNTLIISGTHAGSETFLGSGTIQAKGNGTEDYTSATIGSDLTLEIDGTTTAGVTAAQATGRSIIKSGSGTAVLNVGTATAATTYDFGGIAADNITATLTYTAGGTLASGTAVNWGNIDNVVVATGQTLTLTAGQASGKNIDGAAGGSGSVVVVLDDSNGLDFSAISVDTGNAGSFTASVTSDVTLASDADLGSLVTTVTAGDTLTLTAAQASGKTFNGAGTVEITALQADLDADLSNVGTAAKSTIVGKQAAITQNDTIVVNYNGGGNQTITIGAVGGNNTTKLAAVNTALVAQYGAGAPVATWSGTDLVITAGAANYTLVCGNYTDVDNGNAITAAANVAGTTVTAALTTANASAVTFVGNLGKAAVTTSGDGTLNLDGATPGSATIALNSTSTIVGTAAVLDNTIVTGTGTVTVSALHTTPAANLSGIVAGTTSTVSATSNGDVSVTGDLSTMDTIAVTGTSGTVTFAAAATMASGNTITVGANSAISLSAADADLVTAITGSGTTTVTALESTLAANLSTVTSTTVNADLAMTADRTLTADLTSVDTLAISGAFTATVNSTNVGTGTYTVAAGSALSMTAAKIDALTAATGTATATYNGGNTNLENADTVAFTYNGKAYTATLADVSSVGAMNTAIAAATNSGVALGANKVVASTTGATNLVLTLGSSAEGGDTLVGGNYTDVSGGVTQAAANATSTINVTALEASLAADLTTVKATAVNADLTMTADRTVTADLTSVDTLAISGAFTATVNSTNVGTGTYTVAAGSGLSMTAAKIDALAAATGTATATYDGGAVSLANADTVAFTYNGKAYTATLADVSSVGAMNTAIAAATNGGVALGANKVVLGSTGVTGATNLVLTLGSSAAGGDTLVGGNYTTAGPATKAAVNATSTITVTDLEASLAADLTTVTATAVNADLTLTADRTVTADLTSVDTLAISGDFKATVNSTNVGTGTYTVAAGSTLQMTATKIDALAAATGAKATATYNGGNVNLQDADTVAFTYNGVTYTATLSDVSDLAQINTDIAAANPGSGALGANKVVASTSGATNLVLTVGSSGSVNDSLVGANYTDVSGGVTEAAVNKGSTIVITDVEADLDANLSTVTGTTVTADLTLTADRSFIGNLGNGVDTLAVSGNFNATIGGAATVTSNNGVTVAAGSTVTLTAADAHAMGNITGAGNVAVTDLNVTAAADLSRITASGTKTANVALDVTFSGDLGTGFDTAVASSKTLTIDSARITGQTTSGTGTTNVSDVSYTENVDLSNVGSALKFNNATNSDLTIAAGKTLSIKQAHLTVIGADNAGNNDISGAGNVTITGVDGAVNFADVGVSGTVTADLTGNVTITTGTNLDVVDTFLVGANETLTISAAKATGKTITADGASGNVVITSATAATQYDFSNITADEGTVQVKFTTGGTLNAATTFGADTDYYVHKDQTLSLSAAQANAETITGEASAGGGEVGGSVVITSLDAAAAYNLSNVASGGSGGGGTDGTVTSTITTDTVLNTGTNLGNVALTVNNGVTLTATGAQVSTKSIAGSGANVIINAMAASSNLGNFNANLASVTAKVASGTVNLSTHTEVTDGTIDAIEVAGGATVQIDDAEFADAGSTGLTVSGAGNVTVSGAAVGTVYNMTDITATGTTKIVFADAGTVASTSVLTGVDAITLAGDSVITAVQADGVTFDGTGKVTITTNAVGAQTLKGTSGDDSFTADTDASTIDALDISQGGSDTMVFQSEGNNFTITGFTLGNGAGKDVLDLRDIVTGMGGLANTNAGSATGIADYDNSASNITGTVVTLSAFPSADTAETIAAMFSFSVASGGTVNDKVAANSKMLFIAPSNSDAGSKIWSWNDATGDGAGDVDANELTLHGTLMGIDETDYGTLHADNILI